MPPPVPDAFGGRRPTPPPVPPPLPADDPHSDAAERARLKRQLRRLRIGVIALGGLLLLVVLTSITAGWPVGGGRGVLITTRKLDTAEDIIDRLKDRRVVYHSEHLPDSAESREVGGRPVYGLYGERGGGVLIEFEKERDPTLYLLYIGGDRPKERVLIERNEHPNMYCYGRFLFLSDSKNEDFIVKVRAALP